MTPPEPDLSHLIRVSRDPASPFSHHAASRGVRAGSFVRLRRGIIAPTPLDLAEIDRFDRWQELRNRYLDRIAAVAETRRSQVVVSGLSALAIWNLSFTGAWPEHVELLELPSSARRSKHGVVIHRSEFDSDEVVPWGGHFVTSPARTITDLARAGEFTTAVVALDHALSPNAGLELRLDKDAIESLARRHGSKRGAARVAAVVEFADGRSGSGGESLSRVGIHLMGFEMPELQVRHPHPRGYYDADFKWRKTPDRPPTIGEFDGVMKYVKERLRNGRDAGEVVVAEKQREDFLRERGNGFVRWGWSEARQPLKRLRPKLLRAGIRIVRRPLI